MDREAKAGLLCALCLGPFEHDGPCNPDVEVVVRAVERRVRAEHGVEVRELREEMHRLMLRERAEFQPLRDDFDGAVARAVKRELRRVASRVVFVDAEGVSDVSTHVATLVEFAERALDGDDELTSDEAHDLGVAVDVLRVLVPANRPPYDVEFSHRLI